MNTIRYDYLHFKTAYDLEWRISVHLPHMHTMETHFADGKMVVCSKVASAGERTAKQIVERSSTVPTRYKVRLMRHCRIGRVLKGFVVTGAAKSWSPEQHWRKRSLCSSIVM